MPRLFASMIRFSIWSDMPSPWRPPMAFASRITSAALSNGVPLIATGRPWRNSTVTSSGTISTVGSQCLTPMIGSTISRATSRRSRLLASWVAPSMFASVL